MESTLKLKIHENTQYSWVETEDKSAVLPFKTQEKINKKKIVCIMSIIWTF